MNTPMNAEASFYIDDHAVLFGLIAKYSEEILGDKGLETCSQGVVIMARERGLRIAKRCMANGDELTIKNYLCYSELLDSKKWNKTEIIETAPAYKTKMLSCGWYETWKNYGLEKYSSIYCSRIDKSVLHGFNPQLRLEMEKVLADGDDCCSFEWVNTCFEDTAELDALMNKRARMLPTITKDFLYETGHLLSAFQRILYLEHGLIDGDKVINKSLDEYSRIFSSEKASLIRAEAEKNFLVV